MQSVTQPSPAGFASLGLSTLLQDHLRAAGYTTPTPIQLQTIPHVQAGKDVLGCAQTGTGKTAAFALPILQKLMAAGPRKGLRALILAPTRELAAQIDQSFAKYGGRNGPTHTVIYGGVGKQPQMDALRRGVEVLVACPGRLIDLMGEGVVHLQQVETFVLDEADRMLDMGFIHDVRRIVGALPKRRQTLMFSATMPGEIQKLASTILHEPVRVAVDPVSSTCEPIAQSVYFVEKAAKTTLLVTLLGNEDIDRALVFTRTKHGANRVAQKLVQAGVGAAAIHGNKSQSARLRALDDFKAGRIRVVVATDVAARGIDIKGLSHVINFDLPNEPESYVHRVGRTGRAGASGIALSFCSRDERPFLRAIEKLTQRNLEECAVPQGGRAPQRRPVKTDEGSPAPRQDADTRRRDARPPRDDSRPPRRHAQQHRHDTPRREPPAPRTDGSREHRREDRAPQSVRREGTTPWREPRSSQPPRPQGSAPRRESHAAPTPSAQPSDRSRRRRSNRWRGPESRA